MGLISSVFSLLAAIYSKVSFALTVFRLSDYWMRGLLCFVIFSLHIALGGTALLSFIQCTPAARNWDSSVEGKCWNKTIFVTYAVAAGGRLDSACCSASYSHADFYPSKLTRDVLIYYSHSPLGKSSGTWEWRERRNMGWPWLWVWVSC
jgi:hypothetical protein